MLEGQKNRDSLIDHDGFTPEDVGTLFHRLLGSGKMRRGESSRVIGPSKFEAHCSKERLGTPWL